MRIYWLHPITKICKLYRKNNPILATSMMSICDIPSNKKNFYEKKIILKNKLNKQENVDETTGFS